MSNEQNNNPTEDMANSAKDAGKKVGGAVANKGKQALKKAGKQLLKKAGKAIVKLGAKVLMKVIALLAPYLGVALAILLVIVGAYYVIYEIRGSEQIYVYDKESQNETKKDGEKGYDKTNEEGKSGQTKAIETYYKYMAENSYWQILEDDNEKLESPKDTGVRDYYDKEKQYYLNRNILFSLDETMHRKKFIYPEQFIKPVYYDPEKLELKDITNKRGELIVEADVYDDDNEKTDEKYKSVSDYGLGSIFKYKKDKRTLTVEGTMYKKDIWDADCNCKKTIDTDEPFSYVMEGYPQEIHIITKAVTYVGEFDFKYKEVKTQYDSLTDNSEPGSAESAVMKVSVGQGKKMKTVTYTEKYIDPRTGEEKTIEKEKQVFDKYVPLYGYRKGGVYETLPEPTETTPTDKGEKYMRDYLYNYKINIPISVMGEFNFEERTGMSGVPMNLMGMEAGSLANSSTFQACLQYMPTIEKHSANFGVDPYLVLAKMAQESGCRVDIKDGPMQIVGDGARTVTATNISGQKESYTVYNEGDRRNMEKAVKWGVMYFKALTDMMDGDPLKALQSYNFGEGGVLYIKKNHPDDWNNGTEWMKWREESRLHYGGADSKSANYSCAPELAKEGSKTYGDSCYVENVMRYYAGQTTPTGEIGTVGKPENEEPGLIEGAIKDIFNTVKKAFSALAKDYSEETNYKAFKHLTSAKEIDYALRLASSMEKVILFSETSESDKLLWEKGFSEAVSGGGAKYIEWDSKLIAEFTPPLNIKSPIVTSRFGPRWGSTHEGTDIAVPVGTPLYASADGVVVRSVGDQLNSKSGWGNYVKIKHANENYTLLGHLNSVSVKEGDEVKQGQLVGYSGNSGNSTGPHLHFEFYLGGADGSFRVDSYPIAYQPNLFP